MMSKDTFSPQTRPVMKGYKAFYFDLSCRPSSNIMNYRIGEEYCLDRYPILCFAGFHFCRCMQDVYEWYAPNFDIRVCEVEASGDTIESDNKRKAVTNDIRIVRELSPSEIVEELKRGWLKKHSTITFIEESIRMYRMYPETYVLWSSYEGAFHFPTKEEKPLLDNRADEWFKALYKR